MEKETIIKYLHGVGGLTLLIYAFYFGFSNGTLFLWETISRVINNQIDLPETLLSLGPFVGFCLGVGNIVLSFGLIKRNILTSISLSLVYVTLLIFVLGGFIGGIIGLLIVAGPISPALLILSGLFFIVGIIWNISKRNAKVLSP